MGEQTKIKPAYKLIMRNIKTAGEIVLLMGYLTLNAEKVFETKKAVDFSVVLGCRQV